MGFLENQFKSENLMVFIIIKKNPFLGWKFLDFGNSIDCGSLIMENFMNFKKIIIFNENNGFIGYSLFECTFGKTSFEDIVYCESLF